jgi:hypothetical protein
MEEERLLLFGDLLRRQGDEVLRMAVAGAGYDFMRAVRRCVKCEARARCSAWLDTGLSEGYEAFCPNAGFIERIRSLAA